MHKHVGKHLKMNKKDEILKAMISNPNQGNKVLFFTPKSLKEYLFSDLHVDQVQLLIQEIIEEKPELIRILDESRLISGLAVLPTGNVESFLSEGGFTKIEKDKLRTQKIVVEKESIEFENSKIDLRLNKWQLKTFWWIFGFAILGSGLSLYNFIDNLSPSENTKKQEERIKKLETELRELKTSNSKLNTSDSLNTNEN